jgi:hypothetical protein
MIGEHRLPIVLEADHRPPVLAGARERFFSSGSIGILPLLVVVIEEQTKRWTRGMLAKVQHLNVAVRIPRGKNKRRPIRLQMRTRLGRTIVTVRAWKSCARD